VLYDAPLLARQEGPFCDAYFVDLGYGATPITTLESAQRLRTVNPTLPVLGVEIDRERVAAAQSSVGNGMDFRLGGFNLPLRDWATGPLAGRPETVRLVRAFNVLRQYEEAESLRAYAQLAQHVLPGGLLIEGTSNPDGSRWVANVARRLACDDIPWRSDALVFGLNFRREFDPLSHQAVLPKHLIHRMASAHPIAGFMEAWKQAAAETVAFRVWGTRAWWRAAARNLANRGYRVDVRDRWLKRGYLLWMDPENTV
jgi:hypothetical protein